MDKTSVVQITEWIPEQMSPGTIFILENPGKDGDADDPYWAVLSCPECGMLGFITRKQIAGLRAVICGSTKCPAWFMMQDDGDMLPLKPW